MDALTIPNCAKGTAICLQDHVNVRMDPNLQGRIIGQVMTGQPVTVWAADQGWLIVQTAEGLTGWSSAQFFRVDGKLVA